MRGDGPLPTRTVAIPANLQEAACAEHREAWFDRLPDALEHLAARWGLAVGEPFQPGGQTAWVAPARRVGGAPAVLKIAWRHPEALHEPDGLRFWGGAGAVRLLDWEIVDDATAGLLLEACTPGTPLSELAEPEQDRVIAGLLPRLWLPAPTGHPFRGLGAMCAAWADAFEASAGSPLDPGLAGAGIALLRGLPADAPRSVVLCTDLHAGNVLAAQREPWLAIDPKPYVGDPHFDALQHLLNCPGRLAADPGGLARRWAGMLGLDPERLLLWLFARCVVESAEWRSLAGVAEALAP